VTAPVPPANTVNVDQLPRAIGLWMYQGADYGLSLTLMANGAPLDLAGASVSAQVRAAPGSEELLATFVTAIVEPNQITLNLDGDVVATLPPRARWDCFVTLASTSVLVVAYGPVVVAARTTVVAP